MKNSIALFLTSLLAVSLSHVAHGKNSVVVEKKVIHSKVSAKSIPGPLADQDSQVNNAEVFTMSNVRVDNAASVDAAPNEPTSQPNRDSLSVGQIRVGLFNHNLERLALEFGFTPVIWDERVTNCVWEQVTEYAIPETEPKKIIAYYAETQDFKPLFSNVDSHVRLMYVGPLSRIQGCQDDE